MIRSKIDEHFVKDLDDVGPEDGHAGELLDGAKDKEDEERLVDLRMLVQGKQECVGISFPAKNRGNQSWD